MARRHVVRRLNLELSPEDRGDYDPVATDSLIDWICEADDLEDQEARVATVLARLRRLAAGDE